MYTCNDCPYISPAVMSVLAQTEPDLELIIIDDGSRDGTDQVISQISDSRIRYYHQDPVGRWLSINKAFKEITGEYIVTVGARDVCAPDLLQKELCLLEQAPDRDRIVYTFLESIDERGRSTGRINQYRNYTRDELLPSLFEAGVNIVPDATMMVPGSLLERAGAYRTDIDDPSGEFLARLACYASDFRCVSEPLYGLRAVQSTIPADDGSGRACSTFCMLTSMLELYRPEQLVPNWIRSGLQEADKQGEMVFHIAKVFMHHCRRNAGTRMEDGFFAEGIAWFQKTLLVNPDHQKARSVLEKLGYTINDLEQEQNDDESCKYYDAKRYWTERGKHYQAADPCRQSENVRTCGLDKVTGSTLIEIGCGYGDALLAIRKNFPHLKLTGVDISSTMVEQTRSLLVDHPDITLLEVDGKQLPFSDKQFDIAYTNVSLIHVPPPDIKAYIMEILRIAHCARFYETRADRVSYSRASYYFSHDYDSIFRELGYTFQVEAVLDTENDGRVYLVWDQAPSAAM